MVSDAARDMAMRNYRDAARLQRIRATYRDMYRNQTVEYVRAMKARYRRFECVRGLWNVVRELDTIYDDSDPDTELPQSAHAYQTAEALRSRFVCIDSDGRARLRPIPVRTLFADHEWDGLTPERRAQYSTTLDAMYADFDMDSVAVEKAVEDQVEARGDGIPRQATNESVESMA